jgi:hypothetical protein
LADAVEDCVSAKHDAIDAIVDFITSWFEQLESEVGLRNLVELFREYLATTAQIAVIQDKISKSREDRIAARDGVYDEVEATDYDPLLVVYDKMRLSKSRIDAASAQFEGKERKDY